MYAPSALGKATDLTRLFISSSYISGEIIQKLLSSCRVNGFLFQSSSVSSTGLLRIAKPTSLGSPTSPLTTKGPSLAQSRQGKLLHDHPLRLVVRWGLESFSPVAFCYSSKEFRIVSITFACSDSFKPVEQGSVTIRLQISELTGCAVAGEFVNMGCR